MSRRTSLFALIILLLPILGDRMAGAASPTSDSARVTRVLAKTPVIDGHNDLPWEIHDRFAGKLSGIDLLGNTAALASGDAIGLMTDIPRLRRGGVGGQFWSVWIPTEVQGPAAVQLTLEQIDIVRNMVARYPKDFEMAYSAADIRRIHQAGRIASLIGIEGGHQINDSLAVLRQMYVLGARYMTVTHSVNNDWADSATDTPKHHGLTPFGREVVREMNRLGMMVDLSHVSAETMTAALETSEAPVMFSHSSARALNDHPRNVSDEVLKLVARNGGVVMVNFYPGYVSDARNRWDAEYAAARARFSTPPFSGLYIGQPERAKAALDDWMKSHPAPEVTIAQVADHIDHIRQVAGIDHVGIGSDFDGVPATPKGLEGVDKYPDLLVELAKRGWTDDQLAKVAGENILRVLAQVDAVGAHLRATRGPSEAVIDGVDKPGEKRR